MSSRYSFLVAGVTMYVLNAVEYEGTKNFMFDIFGKKYSIVVLLPGGMIFNVLKRAYRRAVAVFVTDVR